AKVERWFDSEGFSPGSGGNWTNRAEKGMPGPCGAAIRNWHARARRRTTSIWSAATTKTSRATGWSRPFSITQEKRSPWPRNGERSLWLRWTSTRRRNGRAWAISRRRFPGTVRSLNLSGETAWPVGPKRARKRGGASNSPVPVGDSLTDASGFVGESLFVFGQRDSLSKVSR